MMVEAGGTEDAWRFYEDGAPKVTEEVIAQGLEAAKTWIRESIDAPERAGRQVRRRSRPCPTCPRSTTPTTCSPGWPRSAPTASPRPAPSPARPSATWPPTPPSPPSRTSWPAEFEGREKEIKAAVRSLQKKIVRKRIVEEGMRIDGRGPTDIRPLSAEVGLIPTAHGSGLFQRGETQVLDRRHPGHAPHGADARHHRHRRLQALHAPLQHAALRHRRDRLHAGPEAPGDRPRPAGRAGPAARRPPARRVPLHAAGRVRLHVVQRLHVDGVGVRLDPVADGRRCAHQGAGGRHRHGPRLRRGQVHDPHRHPRGRGRVRRHGLQGGRHGRLRHRPPARHQDRRHPRRRAGRGPAAGLRRPA